MKKYIAIATLLTAGSAFANAATNGSIDTSDASLKAYFNFNTSSAPHTAGDINWSDLPTWDSAGYGKSTANNTHPYTTSAGLKAKEGFTVSFDVKDFEDGTLFSATTGGMNQAWRSLSISSSQGMITAKFHGNNTIVGSISVDEDVWTTLTLVGSVNSDATNLLLDFYVNGTQVGTQVKVGATNFINETVNNLQFGYFGNAANSASTYIDNILVYKKALTSKQVASLIPEPSTFGLLAGLGALALVGTRRRRR